MTEHDPPNGALSLLADVFRRRRTGILALGPDQARLGLAVRQGHIVGVCNDRAAEEPAPPPDDSVRLRLQRVLDDLGLASPRRAAAPAPASANLRERLLLALAAEAPAEFEDAEDAPETAEPLAGSTEQLILEAVRGTLDSEAVRASLGDLDRLLVAVATAALAEDRTLTPTENYLISRIDRTSTAREVLQLVPGEPDEVERSLLGLLLTGRLGWGPARARAPVPERSAPPKPTPPPPVEVPAEAASAPPPAAEMDEQILAERREILEHFQALPQQNHFEVLGVQPGCTDGEVKQAYVALVKRYHPDVHRDPRLADLHDVLEGIFIRIREAWEVLGDAKSRATYEARFAPRASVRAEAPSTAASASFAQPAASDATEATAAEGLLPPPDEVFREAQFLFSQGRYWDTIEMLEAALPRFQQGRQEHRGRILLARACARNPNWIRKAEDNLQRVVREDPTNVDAHFELGMIYKAEKRPLLAQREFRKVVDLRPDHAGAAAELGGGHGAARGFLQRIFKKP